MNTPDAEFLTTRELADLLRIKERKVYDLVASGEVPHSRATGKLLFPRRAIDAWIASHSVGAHVGTGEGPGSGAGAGHAGGELPGVLLGSHEPLLEWTLRESRAELATHLDGSLDGLARFVAGEGIAAGLHLYDPHSRRWNVDAVAARCAGRPAVLIEFAWRDRGLFFKSDHADRIRDLETVRGMRLVARQQEAGSQQLLEHLLQEAGLADAITQTPIVRSETDAALAVLSGKADVAFGLRDVAHQHGLEFVPLLRERFDLLVERRAWFEPPMQSLIGFCQSAAFRDRAAELHGYDVSGFGQVHFNG